MRHGTPIDGGLRMVVYPIRPKQEKEVGERCPFCERKYTTKRKPVLFISGCATNNPVFDWECEECAGQDPPKYPTAIVVEDTVNWRGDYWERSLHPSETRYKKATEVASNRFCGLTLLLPGLEVADISCSPVAFSPENAQPPELPSPSPAKPPRLLVEPVG